MKRLLLLLSLFSIYFSLIAETSQPGALLNATSIQAFLTNYRVINQADFFASPYVINPNETASSNKTDNEFWVNGLTAPTGAIVQVLHKDKLLFDPNNQEIIGIQLQAVGLATVIKKGDPLLIKMQSATSAVQNGDRVLPWAPVSRVFGTPHLSKKTVNAQIIAANSDNNEIIKSDIVALNYGSEQGAQVGEILLAIKPRFQKKASSQAPNAIQNVKLGELIVFYTTTKVSYALVFNTNTALHILDRVKNP